MKKEKKRMKKVGKVLYEVIVEVEGGSQHNFAIAYLEPGDVLSSASREEINGKIFKEFAAGIVDTLRFAVQQNRPIILEANGNKIVGVALL